MPLRLVHRYLAREGNVTNRRTRPHDNMRCLGNDASNAEVHRAEVADGHGALVVMIAWSFHVLEWAWSQRPVIIHDVAVNSIKS